ncbi:MAG: hypothetical protein AB1640_04695 [bacterium]
MAQKTRNLFSEDQEKRIGEAVRQAENMTAGEIVPMVTDAADTYPHAHLIGGLIGLLAASLAAVWVLPVFAPLELFAMQAAGFVAAFLLVRFVPALKRSLLSARVREEEVYERALKAFQDLELHRTRDRTGVLIFVSLLEHRVQVLADTGINARVKPGSWNEVLELVLAGIRRGDLTSGLCDAVELCGKILAAEFPLRADDRNEISDELRRG